MDQITENIWLGDISDVYEENLSKKGIDHVITVCQDKTEDNVGVKYTFYNMSDGPDNKYGGDYDFEIYKKAADNMYNSIKNNNTVFIHCHAGQSRSVSVTIGVVGKLKDLEFEQAYDYVKNRRMQADPNDLLLDHAQKYIQNN